MRKQKVQMVVLVAVLTLLIGGYFLLQQYKTGGKGRGE